MCSPVGVEPLSFVFLVSLFTSPGSRPASVTSEGDISSSCVLFQALGVSYRLFAASGFFHCLICIFLRLYDVGVVGWHQRRTCKLRHATSASPPNRTPFSLNLLSQPQVPTKLLLATQLYFFPSVDPCLAQVKTLPK